MCHETCFIMFILYCFQDGGLQIFALFCKELLGKDLGSTKQTDEKRGNEGGYTSLELYKLIN